LLLLAGSVWSGFNFIEGVSLRQQAFDSQQKAVFYQKRYEMAHERLPKTAVEPREIKAAVDLVDAMTRYKATPINTMKTVSRALNNFPMLQIDQIEWAASTDPRAKVTGEQASADNVTPGAAASAEVIAPSAEAARSYLYYEIAEVQGHIAPFAGNYREAIALVTRFEDTLRTQDGVYRVEVVKQPLDISSRSNLQGAADDTVQAGNADFSVRLVIGVGDEKT